MLPAFTALSEQLAGEDSILSDWVPVLRFGVGRRRRWRTHLIRDRIGMAFYGDLFREKGTKSISIPPYDENDVTEEWEKELFPAWWVEGAGLRSKRSGS